MDPQPPAQPAGSRRKETPGLPPWPEPCQSWGCEETKQKAGCPLIGGKAVAWARGPEIMPQSLSHTHDSVHRRVPSQQVDWVSLYLQNSCPLSQQ